MFINNLQAVSNSVDQLMGIVRERFEFEVCEQFVLISVLDFLKAD